MNDNDFSLFLSYTYYLYLILFFSFFCRFTVLHIWPYTNSMEPSHQKTLIGDFPKDKWFSIQAAKKDLKLFRVVGRSLAIVHGDFRDMNQMWTTKGKAGVHSDGIAKIADLF